MPLLEVQHVQKIYTTRFGGTQVQALSNVSFSVEEGEYVAIMGESGSGKTTLLNILAALDRPTAGEVLLEGRPLSAIRERDLAAFRRSHLGFVFQDFNLLDTFSLQDNIYLPLVLAGTDYREMQQKLRPIADQLGISDILAKYPYEVSGGQKQRAAVARALITDPQLILADEPTGALDSRSSDALLELFGELNGTGQTILMVTHSVKAASHAGRVLFLRDGQVYHQLYRGGESQEGSYGMGVPKRIDLGFGGFIKEFPINIQAICGKYIVFSGGGFFRLFPYWLIDYWAKDCTYMMTYFHPRDFDTGQPIIRSLPVMRRFKSYVGIKGAFGKFQRLLSHYDFMSVKQADSIIEWDKTPLVKLEDLK